MNDRAEIFQERVLATKSKKSVYHDYGRTPAQEKGTICTILDQWIPLSFFTSFDKEYYADTACTIDDKDKKQTAKAIQEKTGIGRFFKNDKGANIFVIKNTNTPENGEFLRQALKKG